MSQKYPFLLPSALATLALSCGSGSGSTPSDAAAATDSSHVDSAVSASDSASGTDGKAPTDSGAVTTTDAGLATDSGSSTDSGAVTTTDIGSSTDSDAVTTTDIGSTTDSGAATEAGADTKTADTATAADTTTANDTATPTDSATTPDTADGATCDPGTKTTTWATGCATTAPVAAQCVTGTWNLPGSTTGDPLQCESAHFAVYSPAGTITAAQCTSATDELENVIWPMRFGSPMFEPEPFCKSTTKYKVSVVIHTEYGLTGGCWNGAVVGMPGMWVGPGASTDHWGLAHEFTHSWQCSVGTGLSCPNSNTCGWIYESHANWSAQQLPEYHTTNVHCSEMSVNAPHLYLGDTRDRYCNWQFMEYLKDKYCYQAVNDIWTSAKTGADPFTNIMSTRGWTLSQANDFFGEWAMHNVTWDYQDPAPESTAGGNQGTLFRSANGYGSITDTSYSRRLLRLTNLESMDLPNRRFSVNPYQAPQRYGYNIVKLVPDAGATSVTVTFRGVLQAAANPDFRWGLVATDAGITTARYSTMQRGTDGALTFCVNAGESLFLVVTATPSVQQTMVWGTATDGQNYDTIYRYPYMVQFANAWPANFPAGAQAACPTGLSRHANGGGCAPSSLPATVFVGPYATVQTGTTVSGSATIQDHATIANGTVTGGTIGALSVVGAIDSYPGNNNTFNVSGSAKIQTTFYPLGFYEPGQSATGGWLFGDVEFRGANFSIASGNYTGLVQSTTASQTMNDISPLGPYTWR